MKKALIAVGVIAGAALLARRFAPKCGGIDFESRIERMPEHPPRKWMFRNISAIRTNTDQILKLLKTEQAPTTETHEQAAV